MTHDLDTCAGCLEAAESLDHSEDDHDCVVSGAVSVIDTLIRVHHLSLGLEEPMRHTYPDIIEAETMDGFHTVISAMVRISGVTALHRNKDEFLRQVEEISPSVAQYFRELGE